MAIVIGKGYISIPMTISNVIERKFSFRSPFVLLSLTYNSWHSVCVLVDCGLGIIQATLDALSRHLWRDLCPKAGLLAQGGIALSQCGGAPQV